MRHDVFMNVNRFRQLAPTRNPDLFEVVTEGHTEYDWCVKYAGRAVTGGSVFYCLDWLRKALT